MRINQRFTLEQSLALEDMFLKDLYPDSVMQKGIAEQLQLSHKSVSKWFEHRRKEHRRAVSMESPDSKSIESAL